MEIPDDDTTQEPYDPYYDDESAYTGEDDLSYDTNDDGGDDDDGHQAPVPFPKDHDDGTAIAPDPPILDNDPAIFGVAVPPVAMNDDHHSITDPTQEPMVAPEDLMSTGVDDDDGDESTGAMDNIHIDDADESAGLENDNNTGVGQNMTPMMESTAEDEMSDDEDTQQSTESYKLNKLWLMGNPGLSMATINAHLKDMRARPMIRLLTISI